MDPNRSREELEAVAALVGTITAESKQLAGNIVSPAKDLAARNLDGHNLLKSHIRSMQGPDGRPVYQAPSEQVAVHQQPMPDPIGPNVPPPAPYIPQPPPAPVQQMDISPIIIKLDKLENEVRALNFALSKQMEELKITYDQLIKKISREPKSITIKFDENPSTPKRRLSKSVPTTDIADQRVSDSNSTEQDS